jgi:hypothetical protein
VNDLQRIQINESIERSETIICHPMLLHSFYVNADERMEKSVKFIRGMLELLVDINMMMH